MNKIDILLLSDSEDFTTDYIAYEVEQRGINYLRIDRDLLQNYKIRWDINELTLSIEKKNNLFIVDPTLKGVYYRAPTYLRETFSKSKTIEEQIKKSQWMSFYRNLTCFNHVIWINNPVATFYAENKMVQLKEARRIGFKIPRTIVANTSDSLNLSDNEMVVKSLDTAIFSNGASESFVYTTIISSDELKNSELSIAPVVIQELLHPKIDYRVTVIGESVHSVKILKDGNGITGDWRREKDNVDFIPEELPPAVKSMCREIIKSLGLLFGAIDLIYSKDEFYFIEVNPTGEWAWLVDSANQKIYEDICDCLIK